MNAYFLFSYLYSALKGCIDVLILWLRQTADILFVLGYCVIAFLKLCFLGILRYEIKEMIQKIKLLQTEMAQSILNSEMGEPHLQQVSIMFLSCYEIFSVLSSFFSLKSLNRIHI